MHTPQSKSRALFTATLVSLLLTQATLADDLLVQPIPPLVIPDNKKTTKSVSDDKALLNDRHGSRKQKTKYFSFC